ncbi:MAG: hypothetical protein IKE58_03595 [Blautia sp.]|nr:hypothetical protein [Blautia sp.]
MKPPFHDEQGTEKDQKENDDERTESNIEKSKIKKSNIKENNVSQHKEKADDEKKDNDTGSQSGQTDEEKDKNDVIIVLRPEEEIKEPDPAPPDDGRPFILDWSEKPYWLDAVLDMPLVQSIAANPEALGDSGRIFIPDKGVDVCVWYGAENEYANAQKICDDPDSAVYTPHTVGQPYIADHWSQGFEGIRYCQVGTKAYWKHFDRIDVLSCVHVCLGTNEVTYIRTDAGENAADINPGGLFMYTCNEDWQHVTVTFWQPFITIWFSPV